MEAAKEAAFAANIGVGGDDLSNLLSEDNPDGVMITEEGKITFANKVLILLHICCPADAGSDPILSSTQADSSLSFAMLGAEGSSHVWLCSLRNGGQERCHANASAVQHAAPHLLAQLQADPKGQFARHWTTRSHCSA